MDGIVGIPLRRCIVNAVDNGGYLLPVTDWHTSEDFEMPLIPDERGDVLGNLFHFTDKRKGYRGNNSVEVGDWPAN
jgi:hypothetical protein